MTVVRLADAIVPEVFNRYLTRDTATKSAIFSSGILRTDGQLAQFLAGGGVTVNVPFWADLTDNEPDIASDDPELEATPDGIGTQREVAIRNIRTKGWSAAKLTAELAGSDPMTRILERVTAFWTRAYQTHLVACLTGVFADNAANDSSDMINDIANDNNSAILAAEKVSAEEILDTKQTLGDAGDDLAVIVMHSVVYTNLQKLNLIDFIPDSEGRVKFPTYLGYKVIVDDGVRTVTGTYRVKYWTYLVGTGSIAWAESPVDKPVETDYRPARGNGMGVEELWTRRQYIMHPYGFKWTDASRGGQFPTNAECRLAANWDRVVAQRKQIKIAALVTNG